MKLAIAKTIKSLAQKNQLKKKTVAKAKKSLAQKNQPKKKTVAKAKKSLAQKNQLKMKSALRENHVVRQLEKQLWIVIKKSRVVVKTSVN